MVQDGAWCMVHGAWCMMRIAWGGVWGCMMRSERRKRKKGGGGGEEEKGEGGPLARAYASRLTKKGLTSLNERIWALSSSSL